ncbi:hypothetical protein BJ978_001039 [Agromyces terreus]|uniref:Transcriptional regulator, AbiEi antitoxin, Type IV TA system n=2 Tax=Agromyces terreus TaxID=424795 RepID=A0A9X2GZU4_9MICO|nr:hypothetical protein [Agromyces terreus]MCP2370363.1 hypothetical protein [Agromyces terreus]
MADAPHPFPPLIVVREPDRISASTRELARRAATGTVTRVRAGVYVDTAAWRALRVYEQQLLRIAAVVRTRREPPVLCGPSAAAILGLPLFGVPSSDVHLLAFGGVAPPSGRGIRWHRGVVAEASVIEVAGFRVTDVARTTLDLACSLPLLKSLPAVDRALRAEVLAAPLAYVDGRLERAPGTPLRGVGRERLLESLAAAKGARGVAVARRTVEFGDPGAASPGESVSRGQIRLLGFPRPNTQTAFARADQPGRDIVDFDWPDFGTSGEFDGKVKYTRDEYLAGRDAGEVMWLEKQRERRLKRGHGRDVARWVWSDITGYADGLRRELLAAGLPRARS